MPRRFTDTEKWRDEWWGSLDNDYRMIWLYLVDSCSIAGIWKKDFRGLNFNCNTKITENDFYSVFGSRIIDKGNYFFIPKFLRYQCPKGLNSNKPAIISIIKELELNNLIQIVRESLGNDFLIIKDKDKGKGKDKGTDKGKEKEPVKTKLEIFEDIFTDDQFVEGLAMTHKGKDFKQAFEECYLYHSNGHSPPKEIGEWKQKLSSWLTNFRNVRHPKKETPQDLATALAKRMAQDAGIR